MLRKCPERAKDFSPTWSAAECGVSGMWDYGKNALMKS
ncbi:hypothetical protein Barb4_00284 [Bacteroidales bacterium Barb4]|nr:hypothetical protein Barb4_00284 [Bacteroidales bacterium Barb4]